MPFITVRELPAVDSNDSVPHALVAALLSEAVVLPHAFSSGRTPAHAAGQRLAVAFAHAVMVKGAIP